MESIEAVYEQLKSDLALVAFEPDFELKIADDLQTHGGPVRQIIGRARGVYFLLAQYVAPKTYSLSFNLSEVNIFYDSIPILTVLLGLNLLDQDELKSLSLGRNYQKLIRYFIQYQDALLKPELYTQERKRTLREKHSQKVAFMIPQRSSFSFKEKTPYPQKMTYQRPQNFWMSLVVEMLIFVTLGIFLIYLKLYIFGLIAFVFALFLLFMQLNQSK